MPPACEAAPLESRMEIRKKLKAEGGQNVPVSSWMLLNIVTCRIIFQSMAAFFTHTLHDFCNDRIALCQHLEALKLGWCQTKE